MTDKTKHFIAGLAIAFIGAYLLGPILGFVLGALAGLAKEIYDEFSYGGFDYKDLITTVIGAFVGAVVVSSINLS